LALIGIPIPLYTKNRVARLSKIFYLCSQLLIALDTKSSIPRLLASWTRGSMSSRKQRADDGRSAQNSIGSIVAENRRTPDHVRRNRRRSSRTRAESREQFSPANLKVRFLRHRPRPPVGACHSRHPEPGPQPIPSRLLSLPSPRNLNNPQPVPRIWVRSVKIRKPCGPHRPPASPLAALSGPAETAVESYWSVGLKNALAGSDRCAAQLRTMSKRRRRKPLTAISP
jgi:hypothetical protein